MVLLGVLGVSIVTFLTVRKNDETSSTVKNTVPTTVTQTDVPRQSETSTVAPTASQLLILICTKTIKFLLDFVVSSSNIHKCTNKHKTFFETFKLSFLKLASLKKIKKLQAKAFWLIRIRKVLFWMRVSKYKFLKFLDKKSQEFLRWCSTS